MSDQIDSTLRRNVEQLGLTTGLVVQELGWDDDVDEDLRDAMMDAIDADLVEDTVEAVDVVVLWLRDDEDEVDALVDAVRDLADHGYLWVLTPKVGRDGYVDAHVLHEGAAVSGLTLTKTLDICADWLAHKVVRQRSA